MIENFADFKAVRRPENAMTGARLKPAGHALAAGIGAAAVGKEVVDNMSGSAVVNRQPGMQQAPRMQADFRQNPASGATGDLAMALSDLQQAEGASGLR